MMTSQFSLARFSCFISLCKTKVQSVWFCLRKHRKETGLSIACLLRSISKLKGLCLVICMPLSQEKNLTEASRKCTKLIKFQTKLQCVVHTSAMHWYLLCIAFSKSSSSVSLHLIQMGYETWKRIGSSWDFSSEAVISITFLWGGRSFCFLAVEDLP